jgi:hypothetical protein
MIDEARGGGGGRRQQQQQQQQQQQPADANRSALQMSSIRTQRM